MLSIKATPIPDEALLRKYVRRDTYTDCYRTVARSTVSLEEYVNAFYTTWIFKLERTILNWIVAKPSSDHQARQLAYNQIDRFAAWQVENRSKNQILLSDFQGRTRSWLMTATAGNDSGELTYLYFGSAVTPGPDPGTGSMAPGPGFRTLLGFHKFYSRVLLYSAKLRLTRRLR